jgi:urea transport system permease protein
MPAHCAFDWSLALTGLGMNFDTSIRGVARRFRFAASGCTRPLLVACFFWLTGPMMAARADVIDDVAALFAADSFADTEQAIAKLATSGHPQAEAILQALIDRRLLIDTGNKSLALKSGDKMLDAASGKDRDGFPADAASVRVNNRLRGLIEAALGGMTLQSADPTKRLAAAEGILKSRDAKSLPAVEAALAKEQDPRVKGAFAAARAGILLASPNSTRADRIAAIATLAGRNDADTLGLLNIVRAQASSDDVRTAADSAITAIERRGKIINAIQNIWYGLSLGSVLLLAAAGLAITFGVMGVINMAHGEMVMIGAYTTYVVQELFKSYAPVSIDYSLLASIPAAFAVAGLIGIAIERGIIRFLYGRPLETLLATWGVSLILQQAVRDRFGASNVQVSAPSYMSGSFEIFGLVITYGRLWIVVFTLLAFALLQLVIRATPLGLQMRAVTQNRRMASAMGIRTGRIDALTFGLGSGIAGIAGVALSQIDNVAPNLGQSYIIDSFMVVVFGGVGSLWGTLVSAFSLGIANKLLEPVAGAVLGKILILVLLILFIQKRPRGLFALKGRAIEA